MDTLWSDLKTDGIELEEREISWEDFERFFNSAKAPGVVQKTDDTID
jgi:hypothetical protein